MRRIVTVVLSTITVVVLLFSYHTSTNSTTEAGSVQSAPATPAPSMSPGTSRSPGTSASPWTKTKAPTTATFTGDAVDTQWGPVQVQITVTGGRITQAQAVQYPNGNGRDQQINSFALPVLAQEVVSAQSAQIDTVSGATVTSDGYLQSLQSAIDRAHL